MPTGQEKNIFKWALQQLSFEMKYFFFRREIFFSDTNMILSRAKPAIGGEKAEEKGGSAGRKQVVWEIQTEQNGGWPYF